jgi:F-box/leucine-rich repeat protein 8
LYQKDEEKRQCAIEVINQMAKIKKCNLQKFAICFTGENPLFYAGLEFVDALKTLFGPAPADLSHYENDVHAVEYIL